MNNTVTTQLALSEMIKQCKVMLNMNADNSFDDDDLNFKAFETIIATGLYQILNDGEIKHDFSYLGNNNEIKLIYHKGGLNQYLFNEKEGIF